MNKLFKISIKPGETVMVRSGKYKGKSGKVLAVHPKRIKSRLKALILLNATKNQPKPSPKVASKKLPNRFGLAKLAFWTVPLKNRPALVIKLMPRAPKSGF